MSQAGTFRFLLEGAAFAIIHAREAPSTDGQVLTGAEAERVLSRALRSPDGARLAAFCARGASWVLPQTCPRDALLRRLMQQLGHLGSRGSAPFALLRLSAASVGGAGAASQPTRAAQLAQRVARLAPTLGFRGRSYRLVQSARQASAKDRHLFEAVALREAQLLLREMATDPSHSRELQEALGDAAAFLDEPPSPSAEQQLVLLRREREFRSPSSAGPALTPSQLREQKQTHWIEVRFEDDTGQPLANEPYEIKLADGSVRTGSLDGSGCAYLDGVKDGVCEVKFPSFRPKLAS